MTAQPAHLVLFRPSLVKAVFRNVTPLHVSRPAAWAAASVARTVLTGIIDAARRAAAEESRKKLVPRDLVAAIDRNVELEVGVAWYHRTPTFRGLTGVQYDAQGAVVPARERGGSPRTNGVFGAHRFEPGVKRLLSSQGVRAVPAMVRDLDGIASVFLTDLARDAARVVREDGVQRFGTVAPVVPGGPVPPPFPKEAFGGRSARRGPRRTIGRDDILAATTIQLFDGDLRQRALTEARAAAQGTSAG
ncbi:hypothetical protein [Streptomyces sp. NPDC049881]|uniref:hypothetical protein n=1 Tax=Streptomyces sp. NPDC049881 TaxID=3155778 RepID=UPI00342DD9F5